MPAVHWETYAPDAKSPWDLRRVVHLHRRAAFAAPWDGLPRDLKDRPEASIRRLLAGAADGRHLVIENSNATTYILRLAP